MTARHVSGLPSIVMDMLDSLSDGVVLADTGGTILLANRAARRMLGRSSLDLPASEWSQAFGLYVPGSDRHFPPDELPLARAIRGEEVRGVELLVRNSSAPDGAWMSVSSAPIRDEDGSLRGGAVLFRDITGRKRAEELNRRLASAVEQTADSVLITDRAGTIQYVNPAFESTTGYSSQEVVGQTPRLLKSGMQGPEYYREMWSTLLAGTPFRGTTINRKKNGELYYAEQSITPMTDSDGQISHFVSVLKDMTERRRIQEQEIEMQVASRVQRQLFPSAPPHLEGYDIAGAAFPAQATCGDYYDFVATPSGQLCIVVADVCGHGVGAALIMVATRAWLHSLVRSCAGPAAVLGELNQILLGDLEPGSFVTMHLVCLDHSSGRLTYASAGHPDGYIIDGSGAVRRTLASTGVPLGMFPDRRYSSGDGLVLEPGELVVLVSDGVLESQAPDGAEFGRERLLEAVRSHRRRPAREIIDHVHQAVREFTQGAPNLDDISIIICKRDPNAG